ncbi:KRAB [Lepeophtheirus salmonis]|uniref:KRAB n=1 Tax=Lepeophtheirus salmonis TaxID=72036 RepID=A0A7R8DAV9_LEPSM|nr:KRAB [Lepeophtheirus salmonis]CAF3029292.1 KRAB [Lepeophtheirus salmonis]
MSSTALEPCSSSTTDWIINMFEAEQKSAVFGSLAGYLNTATFADVSLACRNQVLRAHKVHNPAINVVDLDRELSPNGLDLTYEDVQLIIGILYCVGTVEISPERIESLLLIAQVLGIPTLIHLLKLKPGSTFQSFDDHQESLQKQRSSSSVSFFSLASPRCSTTSFANRSNNTNVLESLDPSFLQQLNNLHQIDDIENAFMPHLQNNTTSHSFVDSIEAYDESSIKSSNSLPFDSSGFGKLLPESNGDLSSRSVPLLPDRNLMSVDNVSEPLTPLDRHDQPSKPLSPPALDNKDREEAPKEKNESLILEDGRIQAPKEKNKSTDDEFENVTLASPKSKNQSTLLEEGIKNPPELLPSDDDQFDKVESLSQNVELESTEKEIEESESDEIRVNLDSIASNGKSIRLSIPGASNGSINDEVSSSTQPESGDSPILAGSSRRSVDGVSALKRRRKKEKKGSNKLDDKKNKSVYKCSLCNQSFSSQKAFEKHGNFHIEQSSCTCIECGKTFRKRWALEQHLAIDHRSAESSNDHQASCEDCGKTFGWKRNLLAHVLLHHQKEIRYRCRYCPLTFLKKKLYLNHHTNKHIDKPPTWCQLCFKVFENSKVLEDHQCDGLENTGERELFVINRIQKVTRRHFHFRILKMLSPISMNFILMRKSIVK